MITGLASVKDGDRTILYVDPVGAFPSTDLFSIPTFSTQMTAYVRGGVYQFATTYHQIYLPNVLRSEL